MYGSKKTIELCRLHVPVQTSRQATSSDVSMASEPRRSLYWTVAPRTRQELSPLQRHQRSVRCTGRSILEVNWIRQIHILSCGRSDARAIPHPKDVRHETRRSRLFQRIGKTVRKASVKVQQAGNPQLSKCKRTNTPNQIWWKNLHHNSASGVRIQQAICAQPDALFTGAKSFESSAHSTCNLVSGRDKLPPVWVTCRIDFEPR